LLPYKVKINEWLNRDIAVEIGKEAITQRGNHSKRQSLKEAITRFIQSLALSQRGNQSKRQSLALSNHSL